MKGLQLIATGGALPGRTVTNEDLSRMVDTSDEWITSRTGIRTRHWCTDEESAATLAVRAAKQALERSGLAPADIACCICATLGARGSDVLHAGGPSRAGSAPITMDGKAVFRFAVEALPHCLHTVLDETQRTLDDLSWVVCHQANSRIIDHCVKALHADGAKFYKNMDRHGNTSAASIPVALNELAESGQLHPGQILACIGFGGGLTWGGMIVEYKG